MNTKKRIIVWAISAIGGIAIVITALWLCLRPLPYTACVPEEAKAVMQINPAELQSPQEAARLMENLFSVGAEGIDATLPAYAFVTPNEYIGFAASVSDSHEIEKNFRSLERQRKCTFLDAEGGTNWVWLNAGWLVAWDDRKLWVLGPSVANDREALRQTMKRMPEEGKSFFDTKAGEKLLYQEGALRLFATLDAVPSPYNMLLRLSIPSDVDPTGVQLFANVEMTARNGKSKILVKSHIESENEQILRSIDKQEKESGYIGLPSFPDETPLFFLATRIDGERLLSLIRTDKKLRDLLLGLNQAFDADKLLKATDGRVTLEISALQADWSPTFCLRTETKSQQLFSDAQYWIESAAKQEGMALRQLSQLHFSLDYEKSHLLFGQATDSCLYFCSGDGQRMARRDFLVSTQADHSDGTLVYFHANLQKLYRQPCMKGAMAQWAKMLLPDKQSITYTAHKGRVSTLCLE